MTEQFFKELAALRKANDIGIDEISERTKINPSYFEAIEKGDFSVLPTVYMRLFLRSYAIEIGAEPDKILEDYELYTTGKISEKVDIRKLSPDKSELEISDIEVGEISPYDFRRKIIYGVIAIIALFVLIKFIVYLLEEQRTDASPPVIEQVIPDDVIESSENTVLEDQINYSELPALGDRLEVSVYAAEKSLRRFARRLPVVPPYNLILTALTETKVHVSTQSRSLFNDILLAGDVKEFAFSDTLRFDLWSAQHVRIDLNSLHLSQAQFLTSDDVAVRASIVADGSLSAEFFSH